MHRLPRTSELGANLQLKPSLHRRLPFRSTLQCRIQAPQTSHAHTRTRAHTTSTNPRLKTSISSFRPLLFRNIRSARQQWRAYSSSSSSNSSPNIVYATIGLCCGVYLYQAHAMIEARDRKNPSLRIFFQENMFNSLDNWQAGRWWTLVTSSFTHVNLMHLGANMFSLYSIGPMISSLFGTGGYVLTWIASSVVCCGVSLAWENYRETGHNIDGNGTLLSRKRSDIWIENNKPRHTTSAGASGSVLGFSTALTLSYPNLTMTLFPIPIPIPLWAFNSLFALGSTYCMLTDSIPMLGHAGHLGGMAGGIACGLFMLRR